MKNASCYLRFLSCFAAKNVDLMTMATNLWLFCAYFWKKTLNHGARRQLEQKEAISLDLRASIWATKSVFFMVVARQTFFLLLPSLVFSSS